MAPEVISRKPYGTEVEFYLSLLNDMYDYNEKIVNTYVNPLRPNSDLSQTSHCNVKVLSVSDVMRIDNMITQVKSY